MVMSYCPICGYQASPGDLFCGKCGASLSSEVYYKHDVPERIRRGILFTDTSALAAKFGVSSASILAVLKSYMDSVSSFTVYELWDYSKHVGTSASFSRMHIQRDWKEYHRFLYSRHWPFSLQGPKYLFIVGGDDIIPIPVFQNFIPGMDRTGSSDIFYGYLDPVLQIPDPNTVFSAPLKYHVGRLPLAIDATFDQLQNYLERSANAMLKGIPVQMAYAQSDPNWKHVSRQVVSELADTGLIPEVDTDSRLIYDNIFLSPFVTKDNVGEAFNVYANLYYFNLHGSGDPEVAAFVGFDEVGQQAYEAISPQVFTDSLSDNIVVTEACYGGKHKGLGQDKSILLASICNATLLFLGSSITAYGAVDKLYSQSLQTYGADILAKEFISALMAGYTAGEALHLARSRAYNHPVTEYRLVNMLTILEFSLYGDPSLAAVFPNTPKDHESVPPGLSADMQKNYIEVRTLYSEKSDSILNLVRNRVDAELRQMSDRIQQDLLRAGMRPRKLSAVFQVKYGGIAQRMFCYQTESGESPVVAVDEKSSRSFIITPKEGAIPHICVDYRALFRAACQRFGLIHYEDDWTVALDRPGINSVQREPVRIDSRIEKKSKQQIKTFNAVLNLVYRPVMEHSDIMALSCKSCEYDFSVLMNPLCIILETELKQSIVKFMARYVSLPENMTFGNIIYCMRENRSLLKEKGIVEDFISLLEKLRPRRNMASHTGGISENEFLAFYDNFIKAVTSASFIGMMDLKKQTKNR